MPSARPSAPVTASPNGADHRLGAARAQVHANYIVSQTADGLVIVDQHAAHERLVFEAFRKTLLAGDKPLASQGLLIPEIVDLPEEDCDRLIHHADDLAKLGLGIERFGPGAIAIRETPAMLGEIDAVALVRDLADEMAEWDDANGLAARLDHVAATMACYGSVRSGRVLRPEEMNALLRRWRRHRARGSAITAGRPISNSSLPTSSGCSGEAEKTVRTEEPAIARGGRQGRGQRTVVRRSSGLLYPVIDRSKAGSQNVMNRFEGAGARPAKLRYLDGDFQVVVPGTYVLCAITGQQIPIDELKYWSVARQEAYVDVIASFEAEKRAGTLPA